MIRFGVSKDGKRYVARDVDPPFVDPADGETYRCQHAVWVEKDTSGMDFFDGVRRPNGIVWWRPHKEGELMRSFDGPDDVYEEITQGGSELWAEIDEWPRRNDGTYLRIPREPV